MAEEMGFALACKKFFELLPGQTTIQFAQELKALTEEDRTELAMHLSKHFGTTVVVHSK